MSGTARTAPYTQNLVTGAIDLGAASSDPLAKALIEYQGGVVTRLAIRDTNADVTVDETTGATAVDLGPVVLTWSGDGRNILAIGEYEALNFEYQTFGAWLNGYDTGAGRAGVGTFGARTPSAAIPPVAVAVYEGASTGIAADGDESYLTVADMGIETNFEDVLFVTDNTEVYDLDTGAFLGNLAQLDLIGTGTVSGSGFTGSASSTLTSGTLSGQFYGPNAVEVGGTFSTSGPGGVIYIGSFGGTR